MPTTTTRMNNRQPVDTTGHPRDDGHKAQAQQHAQSNGAVSPKDKAAAIDAAEHGKQPSDAGTPGQQR